MLQASTYDNIVLTVVLFQNNQDFSFVIWSSHYNQLLLHFHQRTNFLALQKYKKYSFLDIYSEKITALFCLRI